MKFKFNAEAEVDAKDLMQMIHDECHKTSCNGCEFSLNGFRGAGVCMLDGMPYEWDLDPEEYDD